MIKSALKAILVIFVAFTLFGICLSLQSDKKTAATQGANLAAASAGPTGGTPDEPKKTRQRPARSKTPAERIAAEQLIADYHRNEVAADARYKGHELLVAGAVGTIGKDFLDSAYVTLGDGFDNVHCDLGRNLQREVAQLQPGDPVVVSGKVTGMILGSPILSNCSLRTVPSR